MGEIYELSELPDNWNKSGIYKLNFPNGECYIGLSNNIRRRMNEHNKDSKKQDAFPVDKAINKYGKIDEFEILEEISANNVEKLREQEKYWIKYYNSTNKNIGYNLTAGGEGVFDENYISPKIVLSDEQLNELINDLMHSKLTYTELGKKYNVHQNVILDINDGNTLSYKDKRLDITYPIRNRENVQKITNQHFRKLSIENELKIKDLLQNSEISFKQIAKQCDSTSAQVSQINTGRLFKDNNFKYPLRNPEITKQNAKKHYQSIEHQKGYQRLESIYWEVYDLLKNTDYSFKKIAEITKSSSTTISNINKGTSHPKEGVEYPIRKIK